MKFGRQLLQEAYPQYKHFYLAYKDLKQAIKLITGSDASAYSISEVTSNFGNNTAFAGSVFRPPESRFQDLLNSEKEKINKFLEVTLSAVHGALRQVLKDLSRKESDERYISNLDEAETLIDEQADQLIFLESYQRINATGFRKITKKYDKHNKSNSSAWYMTQLAREPFLNADFESPLVYLSACYDQVRKRRNDEKQQKSSNLDLVKEEDENEALDHSKHSETNSDIEEIAPEDRSADTQTESILKDVRLIDPVPMAGPRLSTASKTSDVSTQRNAKFLVRPEDVMKLKCLLLKYVPIASLGNTFLNQDNLAIESLINPISSHIPQKSKDQKNREKLSQCCLYFDTEKFETYRRMVGSTKKLEPYSGKSRNMAYRLRWIGENNGEPEKDMILERVKLEEPANSIHEWPDQFPDNAHNNVPDAIVLKQKHIQALLNGTFEIESWLHRKRFSQERAGQLQELLQDAMTKLSSCVPVVQVWYHRTSFRLKTDQIDGDLCFHLDDNIQFVSELSKSHADLVVTKRQMPDEPIITPYPAAKSNDNIDKLPFAVLSVAFPLDGSFPWSLAAPRLCAEEDDCKNEDRHFLASRQTPENVDFPMFIQMITGLTSVTEVWTFAFFLHGFANISRKLGLQLPVPHWYKFLPTVEDEDESEKNTADKQLAAGDFPRPPIATDDISRPPALIPSRPREDYPSSTGRVDVLRDSPGDRLIRDQEEEFKGVTVESDAVAWDSPRHKLLEAPVPGSTAINILTEGQAPPGTTPLLPPPRYLDGGKSLKASSSGFLGLQAPIPVDLIQDQTRAAGTCLEELSKPLLQPTTEVAAPVSSSAREVFVSRPGLVRKITNRCKTLSTMLCRGTPPAEEAPKVVAAAVRVEPKTFFANERTLLQWMNMAVLLATIAITLLNFGTASARIAGLIMAPMAIFFIVHAYMVYAKRGRALMKKEPIDYVDRSGPFILVVSLVTALSLVVALNIFEHPVHMPANTISKASSAPAAGMAAIS
eukprot:Gregarina_sp_Poly_1__10323@NODE_72_length_15994_cov_120_491179_g62_i0_p3_GENE_NODE_72_length_15994_cov_120_491179_g62_i0NODE_72_length_15994_cov_120_491179_g62_i0_p3_ORF_typecomplete_len996_score178_28VTC/PF09359_10/1_7e03VTC/PF09359_10/2_3e29SPX/PF03105_19/4_4e21DUF202/PF02656_15/1e11DUF202/PF02656_15/1_8e04TspO_MBR/PF03073_15/7_7e03TspO_MBR/PF03073_15/0_085DUF2368/PF10166_9/0_71_NODE_72_length_15994_cov_120_491179_g62_i01291715904